ncbi:MAG: nitroreductase family protein [bacterium]|nr:nitroreductase family protein [bacterium]
MDVLDCIHTRRSIRKFLDVPVEWDKTASVVDAGRVAPTAGNLCNWKFIVIENPEKRKAVADASLKQYWMAKAPVHIIICSVMNRVKHYYGVRGERLYSIQETAMAAENMLLTAHALGLGACFVGAFDETRISNMLSIPENVDVRPQGIIVMGYSDEKPDEPIKLRLENVCFFEAWSSQNSKRIKDADHVLWNVRLAERGIQSIKAGVNDVEKVTRKQRQSLMENIKQKVKEAQEKQKQKK